MLRVALALSAITPLLHITVLLNSPALSAHDPIASLSQASLGWLHTISLVLFGGAQIALALGLKGLDRGSFWPYGRALVGGSGALLFYVAYFFATADVDTLFGPEANDPLWVVASMIGFAMGLLQPGLSRLSAGAGRFNALCLVIWMLLIPAVLLIGVVSLGVYERAVGLVYVLWVSGLCFALANVSGQSPPDADSEQGEGV